MCNKCVHIKEHWCHSSKKSLQKIEDIPLTSGIKLDRLALLEQAFLSENNPCFNFTMEKVPKLEDYSVDQQKQCLACLCTAGALSARWFSRSETWCCRTRTPNLHSASPDNARHCPPRDTRLLLIWPLHHPASRWLHPNTALLRWASHHQRQLPRLQPCQEPASGSKCFLWEWFEGICWNWLSPFFPAKKRVPFGR